jgi:hypothetical protein
MHIARHCFQDSSRLVPEQIEPFKEILILFREFPPPGSHSFAVKPFTEFICPFINQSILLEPRYSPASKKPKICNFREWKDQC